MTLTRPAPAVDWLRDAPTFNEHHLIGSFGMFTVASREVALI
jgi:hypothetical protein